VEGGRKEGKERGRGRKWEGHDRSSIQISGYATVGGTESCKCRS